MLTNLFSMFDVSLTSVSPFVLMLFVSILVVSTKIMEKMKTMNANYSIFSLLTLLLLSQFSSSNKKDMMNNVKNMKNLMISKIPVMIFTFVMVCNFFSLFPHVVSVTSHMSLNLTLTMVIWMLSVFLAISNNFKSFLAHMTPSGTPMALMSFMVLIETISNIIRPLTLAVRLMANMVAGHLLLTLLSKFSLLAVNLTFLSSPVMFILTILEMAVSLIQSYVITLLSVLYLKEAFN